MDPINSFSRGPVITGLSGPAEVNVPGGKISVNGGPWQDGPVLVHHGDEIRWKPYPLTQDRPTATISIGGPQSPWQRLRLSLADFIRALRLK